VHDARVDARSRLSATGIGGVRFLDELLFTVGE
jgi:hypothetical protein